SGMSAAVIIGLPVRYCFVFGALMIVTGPTVIGPILKRVPLKEHVATILHWESILLDSVGAVTAIFIMEFLLAAEGSPFHTLIGFFQLVIVGVGVGFAGGWLMRIFLKWARSVSKENINLIILGGALLVFQGANLLAGHSGLISVVVAGMILAHGPVEQREEILEFKATISTLLVSFLFIILAAQLNIYEVIGFGDRGLIFLGVMILLVRPTAVFVSLRKTPLKWNEKLFLSMLAPRGIVAASTASLFALLLVQQNQHDAAQLESLTYLVIVTTVVLQGLPAGLLAHLLRVTEDEKTGVLIVGAHPVGRAIANWLHEAGIEVKLVDTNFWNIRAATQQGLEAYHGNALDPGFIEDIPIQRVGTLMALTPNNEINILMSQLGNKLLGTDVSYQLKPRATHDSHEVSEDLGGIPIFPHLPYLEELNPGLEQGIFEWREMTIPKGTEYNGEIEVEGGQFWPIFLAKVPPAEIIKAGTLFKSEEKAVGIFRPTR
ncbi:MAG: cation:proton antiporter, partial [Kiloniellales bacterium]|nr:cation:proton antiporter [Kiloniellales bacterium]